jgi:hypothetical protein
VIKEYVFACQAIHISVAEERKEANGGTRLEEQKQLVDEVELELVENDLPLPRSCLAIREEGEREIERPSRHFGGRDAE